MSSVEEQLRRDIAAVTKGVVVTDSDLRDARASLEERIEVNEQRGRNRTFLAAAAAAVVVAAIGFTAFQALSEDEATVTPAGGTGEDPYAHFLTGADPTPQLIDGFWREDNGGISILFTADGTVQLTENGMVYSTPGAWGTYEVAGDSIAMSFTGGSACRGTQQTMRASLMKNGDMRTVSGDASGGDCTPLPPYQMTWEHLLPAGPAVTGLAFSGEPGWKSLNDQPLQGDWAAEGGGYVLEMTPEGDYFILDESAEAVDEGRWSLQADDLVLTSSPNSAVCDAGDRFVLADVQTVNPGTPAIRGSVTENACDGTWTPKTWFLIPNDRS